MKVGCLIVYLVGGLKQRKTAFKRIFMEGYLYCDARRALFWVFVFVVEKRSKKWLSCMRDGTYCVDFFDWQKKASAIKGQWFDTWLQAMVWSTRLGARRSQVGWEEGPQLRQKQELLIFSTIDSLQRSYNKWQHACVIFPIRDNNIHTMVPNMFFSFMMVNIFHLFRKLNTFTRIFWCLDALCCLRFTLVLQTICKK